MREVIDLKQFSVSTWYNNFKDVCPPTIVIELSDEVLKCLQFKELEIIDDGSDDDAGEADFDDPKIPEDPPFPEEFKETLKNAFNTLGPVFAKNNWHAPVDARMFSVGRTLKLESIDDLKLVFTTSTVIQNDFANIKDVPFCLSLRKWINIHPASEFRCIVIGNKLIGITPRDWPTYYDHFKEEGPRINATLLAFFNEKIKGRFPRSNYVLDVVLSYPLDPYLLDFGPLIQKTTLYAFRWDEIVPFLTKEVPDIPPVFRYLNTDIGISARILGVSERSQCQ